MMYRSVIFVDFENVQKIDATLIDPKTKVIVIVGFEQDNNAFELVKKLFNNISSIELIKVNGRGPNALDIFIAFYIGKYFDSIKESEIIIYSKDSDYDQLIKHLDGYGISIRRIGLIDAINEKTDVKKESKKSKSNDEAKFPNTEKIIDYLRKQTTSQKIARPKKKTTLENYLYAQFAHKISMEEISEAILRLEANKKITITNNKVDYNNI